MRPVQAYSIRFNRYVTYLVPSIKEAIEYSKQTHGKQWDTIERRSVEGGLPMLWERVVVSDPARSPS